MIMRDGPMPACSFGIGVGLSDAGPIAGAVCCRTRDVGGDVAQIGELLVGGEDDSACVCGGIVVGDADVPGLSFSFEKSRVADEGFDAAVGVLVTIAS